MEKFAPVMFSFGTSLMLFVYEFTRLLLHEPKEKAPEGEASFELRACAVALAKAGSWFVFTMYLFHVLFWILQWAKK